MTLNNMIDFILLSGVVGLIGAYIKQKHDKWGGSGSE